MTTTLTRRRPKPTPVLDGHNAEVLRTPHGWLLVCTCAWATTAPLLSRCCWDWAGHHNEAVAA